MARTQDFVDQALELSTVDGCVVVATEHTETNLRWANNSLTTNGQMTSRSVTVISTVNGERGTSAGVVTRSVSTPDELAPLVKASEAAARDAAPADDAAPLVECVRERRRLVSRSGPHERRGLRAVRAGTRLGVQARPEERPPAVRIRRAPDELDVRRYVDRTAPPVRPAQRPGRTERQVRRLQTFSVGRRAHPRLRRRQRRRADRPAAHAPGLGGHPTRTAGRPLRDAAAARCGRRSADLRVLDGVRPRRRGGAQRLRGQRAARRASASS